MGSASGDRGQANLVGFILVFGFLLISYSLFQAYVIPNQNAEIEYQHYQEVRDDMTELYSEIVTLGNSSSGRQVLVPVTLGMDYPPRLLFFNPPPASGSIGSTGQGTIAIDATDGTTAADLCGGNATTGLVYSPGYHVTTQPDVRYDNGLLYVETAGGEYAMLERRQIVDESSKEIQLYRLVGQLGTRSGVDTLPIEITGGAGPVVTTDVPVTSVTVRSDLPKDEWNDPDNDVLPSNINASDAGDGRVQLQGFSGDYTVSCHSVGLGQRP
ncbi:hypothetical protein GJ633_07080 [Halorubrum sp. CBA1125]|uniref:hypothetical protein n=1 Tax=Halorubrum sp. CBA1125 TaxID=2668072 RepID=UPI0012E910A7|nr:hypothetical protein [Halorubrum sp. CBA1125]MUW14457.1 hypothetical protein [Halorubrum sp. CBA1125]